MKRIFVKKTRRVSVRKAAVVFLACSFVFIGVAVSSVVTVDLDARKEEIARALAKRTGYPVDFRGAIAWDASLSKGLAIQAQDVVVEKTGASGPSARIGAVRLRVDLWPLLRKKIKISALALEKADIRWTGEAGASSVQRNDDESGSVIDISVDRVSVSESRVGFENADGKTLVCDKLFMDVDNGNESVSVRIRGALTGRAFAFTLSGGAVRHIGRAAWPFSVQGVWDNVEGILEEGTLSKDKTDIEVKDFIMRGQDVLLHGPVTLSLKGQKPRFQVSLKSDKVDVSALIALFHAKERKTERGARIFSSDPFDFSVLREAQGTVDFNAQTLVFGKTILTKTTGRFILSDGVLTGAPLSAFVEDKEIKGGFTLNATGPKAQITLFADGDAVDLGKMFDVGGIAAPISGGKTDFSARLAGTGASAREVAGSLDGTIDVFMESGKIDKGAFGRLASDALSFFIPGLGALTDPGITCLAARYRLENGMMTTKGFLLDSELATVEGRGNVNFRDETIALRFRAKPKGSGVVMPPVRIEGDLGAPGIHVDAEGAVGEIVDSIVPGRTEAEVPEVVPLAGANACALALQIAKKTGPALPAASKPLLPRRGDIGGKLRDIGDSLMRTFEEQMPFR